MVKSSCFWKESLKLQPYFSYPVSSNSTFPSQRWFWAYRSMSSIKVCPQFLNPLIVQLPQSILDIMLLRKGMILENYCFIILTYLLPSIWIWWNLCLSWSPSLILQFKVLSEKTLNLRKPDLDSYRITEKEKSKPWQAK